MFEFMSKSGLIDAFNSESSIDIISILKLWWKELTLGFNSEIMNFSSMKMFSSIGRDKEYFQEKGLGLLLSEDAFIIQILLIQTD